MKSSTRTALLFFPLAIVGCAGGGSAGGGSAEVGTFDAGTHQPPGHDASPVVLSAKDAGGESAACAPGQTRACYTGPASTRGIGDCRDGIQSCEVTGTGELRSGTFGPCEGETLPSATNACVVDAIIDAAPPPVADAAPPPPPPADAAPPPMDAGSFDGGSPLCNGVGGDLGPSPCMATLTAGTITANNPGCYVDVEVMSGQTGTLSYACGGGGISAAIGGNVLLGAFSDGDVDMCFGTTFQFSDGCTWESAQTITGSLASGVLQFSYVEQPAPGQFGCDSPCTASGTLTVQ